MRAFVLVLMKIEPFGAQAGKLVPRDQGLGAQGFQSSQNQYESGKIVGKRNMKKLVPQIQEMARFRIGFLNFSSVGRPTPD